MTYKVLAIKWRPKKFDEIMKLASRVKPVSGRFEKIGTLKNKSKWKHIYILQKT